MPHEEKELLLKDLCARLPYSPICHIIGENGAEIDDILTTSTIQNLDVWVVKPYLRQTSSMTEKEKNELKEYLDAEEVDCDGFGYSEGGTLEDYISSIPYSICSYVVDWLNKNMFDFRGLIPKGHALEAKEGMYNN